MPTLEERLATIEERQTNTLHALAEMKATSDGHRTYFESLVKQTAEALRIDLVGQLRILNGSVAKTVERVGTLEAWRLTREIELARVGTLEGMARTDKVLGERIEKLEDLHRDEATRAGLWRSQYTWFVSGVGLAGALIALSEWLMRV